jgi:hypothetical protein
MNYKGLAFKERAFFFGNPAPWHPPWKALPRDREERGVASKQSREVAMLRGASGSFRRWLHLSVAFNVPGWYYARPEQ